MAWILAKKLEMTRIVKWDKFIPITLLEVPSLKVVWFKTIEKDWYEAMVVGIVWKNSQWDIEKWELLPQWKTTLNKKEFSLTKEFPINPEDKEKFKVGDEISLDSLDGIEFVNLVGKSKWKWFTWAMKKHNFHGWPAWHGSKFHRALGSIGNRKPTRTHKWKKMHGHHGDIAVNIKKVPIELINKDIKIIGVRGWVPWARNSLVNIIF